MPPVDQIRAQIIQLADIIDRIGYEPQNVQGPINENGEEIDEEEIDSQDAHVQYYLTATRDNSAFFFTLDSSTEYITVTYNYDIERHLMSAMDGDDVVELEEAAEEMEITDPVYPEESRPGRPIDLLVENTNRPVCEQFGFNVSAYASTGNVSYKELVINKEFPRFFSVHRGLFPREENLSSRTVDDAITPVLNAGEKASRYVTRSLRLVGEQGDPMDLELGIQF